LKNSIFYAAGFYSYCRQELDRIRLKFIKNESEWKKIVHSAFRRKHPQLTDIQGLKFEDIEFRRSIVAELSQVRAAYQKIF
jgi:hypothetical protein